jgi:hypothetical protein
LPAGAARPRQWVEGGAPFKHVSLDAVAVELELVHEIRGRRDGAAQGSECRRYEAGRRRGFRTRQGARDRARSRSAGKPACAIGAASAFGQRRSPRNDHRGRSDTRRAPSGAVAIFMDPYVSVSPDRVATEGKPDLGYNIRRLVQLERMAAALA